MLCAGGQGSRGRRVFAGQMVEDHRLADVGAADNGHDQQRGQIELRQKLAGQELAPFLLFRGWQPDRRGRRFQSRQGAMEMFQSGGE